MRLRRSALFLLVCLAACQSPPPSSQLQPSPVSGNPASDANTGKSFPPADQVDGKYLTAELSLTSVSPDGQWILLQRTNQKRVTYKNLPYYDFDFLESDFLVLNAATGQLRKVPESLLSRTEFSQGWTRFVWNGPRLVYYSETAPQQLVSWDPASDSRTALTEPSERLIPAEIRNGRLYYTRFGKDSSLELERLDLASLQIEKLPIPNASIYQSVEVQVAADESQIFLSYAKSHDDRGKYPFTVSTTFAPIHDHVRIDPAQHGAQAIPISLDDNEYKFRISPDGKLFMVQGDGHVEIRDIKTRSLIQTAPGTEIAWLNADTILSAEYADAKDTLIVTRLTGQPASTRLPLEGRLSACQVQASQLFVEVNLGYTEGKGYNYRQLRFDLSPGTSLGSGTLIEAPDPLDRPLMAALKLPDHIGTAPYWISRGDIKLGGRNVIWTLDASGELKQLYSEPSSKPGTFDYQEVLTQNWGRSGK